MVSWRSHFDRRFTSRFVGKTRRGLRLLLVVIVLAIALTGCSGGLRQSSWPGLISVDGTLYAADLEQIEALNAETGKLYWSFPTAAEKGVGPFYSTPVLAPDFGSNGLLLVAGFSDHTVYALQLGASATEVPDELWSFPGAGGQYVGSGAVANGLFIIGNGDSKVYALNLEDGTEAWQFATHDRVWATPVVIDNVAYVASLDHRLYALDLATGTELWRLEFDGAIAATPVYADGALWLGDFASHLYRVDIAKHEIAWTFDASDWLWATPVLENGVLYFADVSGNVYALDVVTQTMVWSAPVAVGDVVHGRPALNPDGTLLYVAGYEKGLVFAIDTATATLEQNWGTPPANPGRLPGDLVADAQRLYTMPILVPERIQAFDFATGDLLWSAPEVAAK